MRCPERCCAQADDPGLRLKTTAITQSAGPEIRRGGVSVIDFPFSLIGPDLSSRVLHRKAGPERLVRSAIRPVVCSLVNRLQEAMRQRLARSAKNCSQFLLEIETQIVGADGVVRGFACSSPNMHAPFVALAFRGERVRGAEALWSIRAAPAKALAGHRS